MRTPVPHHPRAWFIASAGFVIIILLAALVAGIATAAWMVLVMSLVLVVWSVFGTDTSLAALVSSIVLTGLASAGVGAAIGAVSLGIPGAALMAAWAGIAGCAWVVLLVALARHEAARGGQRLAVVATEAQIADVQADIAPFPHLEVVASVAYPAGVAQIEALSSQCDTLLVAAHVLADADVRRLLYRLHDDGYRVRMLASWYEENLLKIDAEAIDEVWLFDEIPARDRFWYPLMRRALEITTAVVGLVISAPAWLVIVPAIRLTSPGPVLFRQERVGRGGAPFTVLKFRSMHIDPEGVARWGYGDENRAFFVGTLLRRLHLDEIPQLINILRGDMSLIGPRPEQVPISAELEAQIPGWNLRHEVRPGLTGWAQVNFGYGGSLDASRTKLQYDLYYIRNQGMVLDVRTLLRTVRRVLHGADAFDH